MTPVLSFITLLLAAIVAWIGYQQYILARARFKLDLFDKRFAVYKATQKFLSIILGAARFEMGEFWEFRRDTQDAPFLFRDDIVQFLDAVDKAALDLRTATECYEHLPVGDDRTRLVNRKAAVLKQLTDELSRLRTVFGPYLSFDKWT